MSYLHDTYLSGDLEQPLHTIHQRVYATVASMTPKQQKAYFNRMYAFYKQLPPQAKAHARKIQAQLRLQTFDPRAAAVSGLSGFMNVFNNIVNSAVAITGAYLAYEGHKEQKEARSEAQRRADAHALMEKALLEEQIKEQQIKNQALKDQAKVLASQPQIQPAATGGGNKTLIYGGVAAAAAVAAALIAKG